LPPGERLEVKGGKWGRPSRLTDEDRVKVLTMRAEGRSIRAISMALKVPRSTVARAASAR
jgi:IS30 family transposase